MIRPRSIMLFMAAMASMQAAPITYSANVGCTDPITHIPTCVTVSLSWANLSSPVYSAGAIDNFGNLLFQLNVPSPAVKTGSIIPNPQTVFGLSSATVQIITNGNQVGTFSEQLDAGTYADVCLLDAQGNVIHTQRFIATAVPEPAGFALVGLGLALVSGYRIRRSARTGRTVRTQV